VNTPEKCPKCGAKVIPCEWNLYIFQFECGSILDLDRNVWSEESEECIARQRDRLAERVKRLEESADAMAKAYEEIIFDRHDAEILESYRKVRGDK